jgi:hypothetical protein
MKTIKVGLIGPFGDTGPEFAARAAKMLDTFFSAYLRPGLTNRATVEFVTLESETSTEQSNAIRSGEGCQVLLLNGNEGGCSRKEAKRTIRLLQVRVGGILEIPYIRWTALATGGNAWELLDINGEEL